MIYSLYNTISKNVSDKVLLKVHVKHMITKLKVYNITDLKQLKRKRNVYVFIYLKWISPRPQQLENLYDIDCEN